MGMPTNEIDRTPAPMRTCHATTCAAEATELVGGWRWCAAHAPGPDSVHVITFANVHPEKDPTAAQLKRAKVTTTTQREHPDPIGYAYSRCPQTWKNATMVRHTIDGTEV